LQRYPGVGLTQGPLKTYAFGLAIADYSGIGTVLW